MLFNSHIYILFISATALIYFGLNRLHLTFAAKAWLLFTSFTFYAYWNTSYLPLIISSIVFNYAIGSLITRAGDKDVNFLMFLNKRRTLILGILLNLGFLGYYKYTDFFLKNFNFVAGTNFPLLHLILPLAISFFTFQQIAYLVDSYKGETKEYDFLNYCIFVSFFPQLIAGPIVHHKEMMPQFARLRNKIVNWQNVSIGIVLFSIGLFKKVAIADTFAVWATEGFDNAQVLTFLDAWATSLSFTFQLYYDFSGYTDMAIGSAYLFNIKLPINFNSPYKATNIQDFWRRWHITLSRWLKDYLYIPFGGNRKGEALAYLNLLITFFIGGLWHGAGWTFVLWGIMHGTGAAIHRAWGKIGIKMPVFLAWFLTFIFVNFSWVLFRAKNFEDSLKVFKGMFGMSGFMLPHWTAGVFNDFTTIDLSFGNCFENIKGGPETVALIIVFGLISLTAKNSMELTNSFRLNWLWAFFIAGLFSVGFLDLTSISEFIYFQF